MKLSTEQVLTAIRNANEPLAPKEIGAVLTVRGVFLAAPAVRRSLKELRELGLIRLCAKYNQAEAYAAVAQAEEVRREFRPLKAWRCSIIPVREGNAPAPDPYAEFRGQRHVTVGNQEFSNA